MSDSMEQLVQEYRQTFKAKAKTISKAWELAQSDNWQSTNSLMEIAGVIHKLKGSSGAYGFDELFTLTSSVDEKLKRVLADPSDADSLEVMQHELHDLVHYLNTSG